ncbi:peptide-methionine (S)-S-oxide reductase [Gammaproteobacteria bacterium 53_120_T64]|nr:peptide-methionine (S)-S-oxide reductase [Gammaproteobacteria bacterium 53_120_T64]
MPINSTAKVALIRLFTLFTISCLLSFQLNAKPLDNIQRAIFAGGCFWCMEPPFDALEGVISTTSGYIGGQVKNPTYKQVSSGTTGHTEALEIVYNPDKISYQQLLSTFWLNIDPVDRGGQFCDRGSQYRSEIFYTTNQQYQQATQSKLQLDARDVLPAPVHTPISPATEFFPAEAYHQNYYQRNPKRYQFYSWNCGRKQRLLQLWGKTYD